MNHATCIILFFQLLSLTGASESGIVGGKVSKPHSRPYMASLWANGNGHTCGGILIRADIVLTAAHCKGSVTNMTVVLGAHDISKTEPSQQRISVAEFIPHPQFSEYEYDIMLLKLKKKAKLNKNVTTIGLPKMDGKIPANIECNVTGWGRTGDTAPPSSVLRETTEKVQFSSECKAIWQQNFNSQQMICTKFNKKTGGVCQGDSGGPLICNSEPQGITAFTLANDCNNPKYPHVFTKIHFFLPWIKENVRKLRNVA